MLILDLPGPQFLLLFWLLLGVCLLLVHVGGRLDVCVADQLAAQRPLLKDPYRFAGLRGGRWEVARVAAFRVLDLGWVEMRGDKLQMTAEGEAAAPAAEIEQQALSLARQWIVPVHYMERLALSPPVTRYMNELVAHRLVYGAGRRRWTVAQWVVVGFCLLAVCKLVYALAHGHSNVWFLLGSLVVLSVIFMGSAAPDTGTTVRGRHLIRERQHLIAGLRQKYAQAGKKNSDDTLNMVAIFGFAALPGDLYPNLLWLMPPPVADGMAKGDGASCAGAACSSGSGGSNDSGGSGCASGCGGCGGGGGD